MVAAATVCFRLFYNRVLRFCPGFHSSHKTSIIPQRHSDTEGYSECLGFLMKLIGGSVTVLADRPSRTYGDAFVWSAPYVDPLFYTMAVNPSSPTPAVRALDSNNAILKLDSRFFICMCFFENLNGEDALFKTSILLSLSLPWVVMATELTCVRMTHNATRNSNMSFAVYKTSSDLD